MNFFGHATLAYYASAEPAFVLGSMLPDFASMIRTRPPPSEHHGIAAGIRFHHRTDQAFHQSFVFRELCKTGFQALRKRGVPRGSARAVAHVGIELLLDGVLSQDANAARGYTQALEQGAEARLGRYIAWQDNEARLRFANLLSALELRGVLACDSSAELVVLRLVRALSGRPRLQLEPSSEKLVHDWVSEAAPLVRHATQALLADVQRALAIRDSDCA